MRICIIGDYTKNKKEIDFLDNLFKNSSTSNDHIIKIPIYEYRKEEENDFKIGMDYYIYERGCIYQSDYIILICNNRSDKSFIFNFGLIFGTKKEFKVLTPNTIKEFSIKKFNNEIKK